MPTKRYKPEQIVTLLRQIEVEIANGKTTPQACMVLFTKATAKVKDGLTRLEATLTHFSAPPDQYVLQIRKVGSEWSSYDLVLRL